MYQLFLLLNFLSKLESLKVATQPMHPTILRATCARYRLVQPMHPTTEGDSGSLSVSHSRCTLPGRLFHLRPYMAIGLGRLRLAIGLSQPMHLTIQGDFATPSPSMCSRKRLCSLARCASETSRLWAIVLPRVARKSSLFLGPLPGDATCCDHVATIRTPATRVNK